MAEAKLESPAAPAAPAPRKRGRPRTVTDDQEIPEVSDKAKDKARRAPGSFYVQRRRKQLRVAQQAYRKRKENTITNLQTRVQELESGIEDLSQSFLSFSNLLLEAKILETNPDITFALQKITQQCVALAKQGCDDESGEKTTADIVDTVATVDRSKHSTPEINLDFDTEIVQANSISFTEDPFQPSLATLAHWTQLPPTPPNQDHSILPFGIVYSSPPLSFSNTNQSSPSPPTTISSGSLIQQGRWNLSQRLVRQCCQNGYWLLTSDPCDEAKIEHIFRAPLSINERNRMISSFYDTTHDEVGDRIERIARVLNPVYNVRETLSPEQLTRTSRAWKLITEAGAGEYMDASGVQRYLERKGVRVSDSDTGYSSPSIDYTSEINATMFIRYLSLRCICVGAGPAFKRKDIEKALYMSSPHNQWQI
ncbi:bZIP transcription factor bZIP-1 [Penicillium manginii]|uniref:bZIP transcription factor bZIP-1 n=1 Tax=Penicillium manginii TaxID=203109 RepID=UPI002548DDF8|nr:bZIP transcription factor bZIP-1 [Penicillium manginii]KAJ5755576.1 bZIP transcription factor bZIP-1 [Penicillium manginii]